MSKCSVVQDYDIEMNPVEPCDRTGWPDLDGLCPYHWGEYVVQPAMLEMDRATQKWSDALTKRYRVEVAQGLRPGWQDDLTAAVAAHGDKPYPRLNTGRSGTISGRIKSTDTIVTNEDDSIDGDI